MAVGDVYRLAVHWRRLAFPHTAVNVFHFKQTDALILDSPGEDLVGAFQDKVEPHYLSLVTDYITIFRYTVSKAPTFAIEYEISVPGTPGSLTGQPLPARTSACINWRTATPGRRGRGRTFLPPASEGTSAGNGPESGYISTAGNFINAMITTMAASGLEFAAWEFQVWSELDAVARVVTNGSLRASWSSQRDRGNLY